MAQIHIAEWPHPIESARLRILEAALDAGVPFPHNCGSGECGTCKCQLLSGQVTSDRHSPDALSPEEAAAGLILACRARPVGDVQIRWLSKATVTPMVKLEARVTALHRAAHDVIVVGLRLPEGQRFDFRPGQFAKLRFARLPARSYSMASQPGSNEVEFHIRAVPDGRVSSYVADGLGVGDKVEVRGPFGDACWAGVEKQPLLLLAGGTGLAPMMSVLDAALKDGQAAEQIHLYHGVRTERDLYAGDTLKRRAAKYGFRFVPVYADGAASRTSRSGHLHQALGEDFASLADARLHVAGPPPMVDAVRELALRRGAAPERVLADAFFAAEPDKKSLWERITAFGKTGFGALE